ncbi:very short patch repair endonuclease [Azospirillum argentinense]|nr:very short patch repair endonuclease [Azospirillum argentinense]
MDVLTPEQRRHNMSRIRGKDTKPELMLRRGLHAAGLRFRLHSRDLPGRPDLVFSRHRAVVLVHGCFWHGHDCPMCKMPATRPEFWAAKLDGNRTRDWRTAEALRAAGWRLLTVWECSLKGPARLPLDMALRRCADFIRGEEGQAELTGDWAGRVRAAKQT